VCAVVGHADIELVAEVVDDGAVEVSAGIGQRRVNVTLLVGVQRREFHPFLLGCGELSCRRRAHGIARSSFAGLEFDQAVQQPRPALGLGAAAHGPRRGRELRGPEPVAGDPLARVTAAARGARPTRAVP